MQEKYNSFKQSGNYIDIQNVLKKVISYDILSNTDIGKKICDLDAKDFFDADATIKVI